MKRNKLATLIGMMLATGGLVACGGGGTTASSTTGTAAVGVITGFGSIYVNGIKYHTDSTSYHVDDNDVFDDSSLEVGMVVKVIGSVNADGRTGTARAVFYDDELEGPVQALAVDPADINQKTFTIFGINVVVNSATTKFANEDDASFSFTTLANGDNLEVSGFFHNNTLIASYIEKQDSLDDDFELKGTVSASTGSSFVLTHKNGGTLNVSLASGAEIPSAGILDGQYVEVEGAIPDPAGAPNDMLATKVELEDNSLFDDSDFGDSNDEAEIRGILSYDAGSTTWSINGQEVDLSNVSEYKPSSLASAIADTSADGMMLKIEGGFQAGVLIAREVENKFGAGGGNNGNLEFKGTVNNVSVSDPKTGTITLSFGSATGTVEVATDGSTVFMNDDSLSHFTLNQLSAGNYLEIKAYKDSLGNIIATYMERDNTLGEYEVEGLVEAYNPGSSITIQGVTFVIDGGTFVDDTPVVGQLGDAEDVDGDGIAETVDRED